MRCDYLKLIELLEIHHPYVLCHCLDNCLPKEETARMKHSDNFGMFDSYFLFSLRLIHITALFHVMKPSNLHDFFRYLQQQRREKKSATHHLPKPQAAHGYKLANDDYHEIYLYNRGTCNQGAFVRFTRNSFVAKTRLYIDNNHSERRMLVSALQVLDSMRCA